MKTRTRTVVNLIYDERWRQVHDEGWTAEHDDTHSDGAMAVIAAALAVNGTDAMVVDPLERTSLIKGDTRDSWGLIEKHSGDRVRQLVIAGALIVAEIEREMRAT
jgi:hypothetical protein